MCGSLYLLKDSLDCINGSRASILWGTHTWRHLTLKIGLRSRFSPFSISMWKSVPWKTSDIWNANPLTYAIDHIEMKKEVCRFQLNGGRYRLVSLGKTGSPWRRITLLQNWSNAIKLHFSLKSKGKSDIFMRREVVASHLVYSNRVRKVPKF